MTTSVPKSVLFVCLGNICRSPSAESVMRHQCHNAQLKIRFDSAGTANYHVGEHPDKRAINAGKALGFNLVSLKARQVVIADFYDFDIIFAMDGQNLKDLQFLQAKAQQHTKGQTIATLQLFDPTGKAVADPYYGDKQDFVAMFEHLQAISQYWIKQWQKNKP